MLHIKRTLCLFIMALLLVQPVFAETVAPTETIPEPDIITAVYPHYDIPAGLTSVPLYKLVDGTWLPVLAAAEPQDVTADFAGSYGIPSNAQRGYAFSVTIHPDAVFDDGAPITADCFLDVIRADFEETWLVLANAAAIRDEKTKSGTDIVSLQELGFSTVSEAWAGGYKEFFVDMDGFWGLSAGWRALSDRTRFQDFAMPGGINEGFVSAAYLYNAYLVDGAENSRFQRQFLGAAKTAGERYAIEDLGLIKQDDRTFVLILQQPATASMMMSKLSDLFLDGKSYGPYTLTSKTDDTLILEPNPHWWSDPDPRGYDRILCQKIGS